MSDTTITLANLNDLADKPHVELVPIWQVVFDGPPPTRMSAPLMRRILAFQIQQLERKSQRRGLSQRDRDRLIKLGREETRPQSPTLAPGGRLIREWNGITHEVEVLEKGFVWRGQAYRSLSAIAEAITGTRWSGPRFFGLAKKGGRS